jgi:hypothetical protein
MNSVRQFLNGIMEEIAAEKGISVQQLKERVEEGNCRRPECTRKAIEGQWYCWPHLPKSAAGKKCYYEAKRASEAEKKC